MGTYNKYKSDISQGLKNKPKYLCNLIDENKLRMILNYFTNKSIISLNMDHMDDIDDKKVLISFMMSPIKDSIFFENIANNFDCHFSISLTAHITDKINISLLFCKCTSKYVFI